VRAPIVVKAAVALRVVRAAKEPTPVADRDEDTGWVTVLVAARVEDDERTATPRTVMSATAAMDAAAEKAASTG
jgi:hypothetical protein